MNGQRKNTKKKQKGSVLHITAMPDGQGVIVGIKGGDLHALDPNGDPIWTFHTGNIFTKPSFGPGGITYTGSGETLYALESKDKFLKRRMEEEKELILSSPDSKETPTIEESEGWILVGDVKLPIKNL